MKLHSQQLEAFYQLSQTQNFTEAAKKLFITQSALSQRIAKLEEDLETTLLIREKKGVTLTSSGQLLLHHCKRTQGLEDEVLQQLKSGHKDLAGVIRIAAYSSVLRSIIVPKLASFQKQNPHVSIHFSSHEVIDLEKILTQGKADLIVMDYEWNKAGIKKIILGKEEFVLIEPKQGSTPLDVFLDHGPDDNATESFFRHQGQQTKVYRRAFMGDVYGILDGVELGYGMAVMSKHLITPNRKVRIVPTQKKYERPICLHYYDQPYYTKLQTAVMEVLKITRIKD